MAKKKQGNFFKAARKCWPLYLMTLPGLIYLFVNNYMPMFGLVLAFKQYNVRKGIWGSPFIGLKNFEFLFKTKDAWIITRNTVLYNAVFIVLGTVFAITVAILLNEVKSSLSRKVYQTVILIPFMVSIVVVSYLANAFLSADTGFINKGILNLWEKNQWHGTRRRAHGR